jgi:hypothetical protein
MVHIQVASFQSFHMYIMLGVCMLLFRKCPIPPYKTLWWLDTQESISEEEHTHIIQISLLYNRAAILNRQWESTMVKDPITEWPKKDPNTERPMLSHDVFRIRAHFKSIFNWVLYHTYKYINNTAHACGKGHDYGTIRKLTLIWNALCYLICRPFRIMVHFKSFSN